MVPSLDDGQSQRAVNLHLLCVRERVCLGLPRAGTPLLWTQTFLLVLCLLTLCSECVDDVWATSSRTMASHCSALWRSRAVTVKATCSEGIFNSRVAKTVPSALTLKSKLLVSYCVPLVSTQLLNLTARGTEMVTVSSSRQKAATASTASGAATASTASSSPCALRQ